MFRKDATLREVLTTLRIAAPHVAEYRHPLARFAFRALYADSGNRGRFAQKELGMVYSRDILGEPGSLDTPAVRLLEEYDGEKREPNEREKDERTLDELRFVPGDYLSVSVILPKSTAGAGDVAVKGAATNGWRNGHGAGKSGSSWPENTAPAGRGGGHWRGGSDAPAGGRGRGGRGDPPRRDTDRTIRDRDRDIDRDRRIPPPRRLRDSPPPYRGGRDSPPRRGGRVGGRGRDRRSRSRSYSPSPPRRRGGRY